MWNPVNGFEFENIFSLSAVPEGEGAVVIIPARYHYRDVSRINEDLSRFPWVVLMLVGDEESIFPTEELRHPNFRLWVMTPIPGKHKADHFLTHGYTPQTRPILKGFECPKKYTDWFFAGQITHQRRKECIAQLEGRIVYPTLE